MEEDTCIGNSANSAKPKCSEGITFRFISYDNSEIDEKILSQNLNRGLFIEIYSKALDDLYEAFDNFKDHIDFKILKEDIKRKEKLYEVLIEGSFIANN